MLSSLTLGPRLSLIRGRFNSDQRKAIEAERKAVIDGINAACLESARVFTTVEDLAAMPEHAGKTHQQLFMIAVHQHDPYPDHTFNSLLHRMDKPVHLTIDVGAATEAVRLDRRDAEPRTGQSILIGLKSENPHFNISSSIFIDPGTQNFLHSYWDTIAQSPAMKTRSVSAWEDFDRARHDIHRASYEIFRTAFWEIGISAGLKLSTDLFNLVAITMPSDRNPMPQIAADAWDISRGYRP